jgi:hypothetical protein
MVDNAFLEEPLPPDIEEIVHDVVTGAFDLGDAVHEECNDSSGEGDAANLSEHGITSCEDVEGHETSNHFDPRRSNLGTLRGFKEYKASCNNITHELVYSSRSQ